MKEEEKIFLENVFWTDLLFEYMEAESERFCPPAIALKDEPEHVAQCGYRQNRLKGIDVDKVLEEAGARRKPFRNRKRNTRLPNRKKEYTAPCRPGDVRRVSGESRKGEDGWHNPPLVLLLERRESGGWKVAQTHERKKMASRMPVPLEGAGLYAEP